MGFKGQRRDQSNQIRYVQVEDGDQGMEMFDPFVMGSCSSETDFGLQASFSWRQATLHCCTSHRVELRPCNYPTIQQGLNRNFIDLEASFSSPNKHSRIASWSTTARGHASFAEAAQSRRPQSRNCFCDGRPHGFPSGGCPDRGGLVESVWPASWALVLEQSILPCALRLTTRQLDTAYTTVSQKPSTNFYPTIPFHDDLFTTVHAIHMSERTTCTTI